MSAERAVCHGCGRAVHPLLAPAPLVQGQRVVMCCSDACRERVRSSTPAAGVGSGAAGDASDRSPSARRGPSEVDGHGGPVGSDGAPDIGPRSATEPSGWAATVDAPPDSGRSLGGWVAAAIVAAGVLLLAVAAFLLFDYTSAHFPGDAGSPGKGSLRGSGDGGDRDRGSGPDASTAALGLPPARGSPGSHPDGGIPKGLMALARRCRVELESYLESNTVRFRLTAAEVLAEQGHRGALAMLRKDMESDLWTTRRQAAEALARLGHQDGVGVLKEGLESPRKPVRWASAFALARCGDRSGEAIIRQLTRRGNYRMTAHEALVRLGDDKSRLELLNVMQRSRAPYDRLRAAVALGRSGSREGVELLRKRLAEQGMNLGVALALQQLGVPEAKEALWRALDHTALRVEAARALRSYDDVSRVEELAPHLESDSEDARLTAAAAILILTTQARVEVQ